jgi:amino acid transporter
MSSSAGSGPHDHRLGGGSIHKWHVLIQSVAFMAPAGAIVVTTPQIIAQVGYGAPLVFVLGTIGCLCVANTIAEFGRRYPSAGSFYTANCAGLGSGAGFLTGWLMVIGYTLIGAGGIAFAAFWAQLLSQHWGVHLPFAVPFLVFAALLYTLSFRGIKISIQFDATTIFFEVGVVGALAITALALFKAPAHVSNAAMFSNAAFAHPTGFFLAFVFAILAFVGFESGAALAEETKEPRKAIAFATFGATTTIGVFYILWHWAVLSGFGAVLTTTSEQPLQALSDGLWGQAFFPLIAFIAMYGTLGFSIASHNTVSRAMYAIGRDGLLPSRLARTHVRFRTPIWAIAVVTSLEIALGLSTGLAYGGDNSWYYLGFIATLALVLVYISINVSLVSVMWRRHRSEFRAIRHLAVPALGTIVMGAALVGNIYPVPAAPYRWYPYLVLGLLLAGGGVYLWLRRARPDNVQSAGAVLAGADPGAALVTDQALGGATA